jgi:hypothetical protein
MLDGPQLQRRLQTGAGTTAGNVVGIGIETAPIDVTSASTGKKRKTSASAGLAEATASGTKALVASIDKIRDSTEAAEEKKSKDLVDVAVKQLEYFRFRDQKINKTQKGLVQAISSLSQMMGRSFVAQQARAGTASKADTEVDSGNILAPSNVRRPCSTGGDTACPMTDPPNREEEAIAVAATNVLSSDSSPLDGAQTNEGSSM